MLKSLHKITLCAFLVFITLLAIPCNNLSAQATDNGNSSFISKKQTCPRYWIAYEYCWINNKAIPESLWKQNIDWIDTNFKSFGYDMICNDGWIENAQTISQQGYITKYNDEWTNGFAYWSDYITKKGMKVGIYYNPMWLTKAAFDQNVTVNNTSHHAKEIVGVKSFNDALYWVDVEKPGAKEWIQGYVNYFIGMRAQFLRIDFLENYENNYGTAKYELALKWIKEAAAGRIVLSLVMPNCFNHGKTELLYGDMIRTDDDCFNGGWDFVSERRRGQWKQNWPQYGNAFDGFIKFADIGGRGQMVLDGDFIRLNTLANDMERKSQLSLFIMAGSPITIADQFNTIGNHAWVYQNKEMLALNDEGFVGKPLSYDFNDMINSSRWVGQLPDGDWIVGLFNRENSNQTRSIDLVKELGFEAGDSLQIKDIWSHTDLEETAGTYTVNLAAHDCRVLRIKNNKVARKYEAEVTSMIGGAKKNDSHLNYSGPGYVANFDTTGAKILLAISVPSKGNYLLNARYSNNTGIKRTASIYINDAKSGRLIMPNLEKADEWGNARQAVFLKAGVNYIAIQYDRGDNGMFCLDYIQVLPQGMQK